MRWSQTRIWSLLAIVTAAGATVACEEETVGFPDTGLVYPDAAPQREDARATDAADAGSRDQDPGDRPAVGRDQDPGDLAARDQDPGDLSFGHDHLPPDIFAPDAGFPDAQEVDGGLLDGAISSCPVPPQAPAPACTTLMCGNGMVDTCTPCAGGGNGGARVIPPPGDGGIACPQQSEQCDGVIGQTCTGLGYAGGMLGCTSWCAFDTSTCSVCETNPRILACAQPAIDAFSPVHLALAATDQEIAIAWISGRTAAGETGLHFARFNPDLTLIGETACFGPRDGSRAAVAAVPGGWLVAASGASGVTIQKLDAQGSPSGSSRLIAGAHSPMFAQRPNDGPLLVVSRGTVEASLLDSSGQELWRRSVLANSGELEYGSAVFTGDGFLIAARVVGVNVVRVELDGTVGVIRQPGTTSTEYPQLAWTGTEARLVWADFGLATASMLWARLDSTGARLSVPVNLGGVPLYFNPSPALAFGDDTLILLGGHSGGTGRADRLDITRLDPAGAVSVPPFGITRDPGLSASFRLARRGSDAVAAWIGEGTPGRIVLARVMP